MKKITLWVFVLFAFGQISAQTTVTIGTGVTNNSGVNSTPVYRSSAASTFNFSQSVQLLTPADLSAVGITAGSTITKIAYKKTNAFTLSPGRTASMKIYMKNTSTTTFGATTNFATYSSGSTLCYNNASYSDIDLPASAGWVEFIFTTPFNYNGGSIEVGIDWAINSGTGNASTGAFAWEFTAVTNNQAVGTSDSVPITTNLATTSARIYNTQLTFTNLPCSGTPAPGNTIASAASTCPAPSYVTNLSLQNPTIGSGVTYQWYNLAGLITGATNAVYAATITAADTFYCAVTCAGTTTNSTAVNVAAAIPGITAFPYSENYTTFPANCWVLGDNGDLVAGPATFGASTWAADGLGNVGTTGAIRYEIWLASANDWMISPSISIPTTGYELKFDAAATQYASINAPTTAWEADDKIEVLISTTGFTAWTPIFTYDNTNQPATTATPNIINLSAYAGQTVRIAFRAFEGTANGAADIDFSIDNFQVRISPTCPDQTGLVIGGITATGANVSWDGLSGVTGYEYAVTTSATPPATGTATTNTFAIISTLSPQTVYYLHVRAACTGSIFGNWSTITFTTLCAPINVPIMETFTTFLPNACWFRGDNGDLVAGPATFGTNTWVADGLGNVGTTGAFRYEIWLAAANDWIISPQLTIPATGYELKFDAAATQYNSINAPTTPWEADDKIEVLISTTGFTAWTPIFTYDNTNQPSTTATPNIIDLSAYAGQTVRIAFRAFEGTANGAADIDFSIDNFQIRLTPTCVEPLNLIAVASGSSTANVSWDATSPTPGTGYEYFVSTANTIPVAAGTATTATFAVLSGLLPQTTYYVFVRANCGAGDFSAWTGPISFTTACTPITTFPWNEGFEGLTTVGTTIFPTCWSKQNGDWASQNTTSTYSNAHTGTRYIRNAYTATNEYIWTPGFDLVAGTSYDFSSYVQGDNGNTWVVDYFVNSVQNSTGATQVGASYTIPGSGTPYTAQPYALVTRSFVPTTTGTYYFAVRVNEPTGGPWYASFDDFELKLSPACPTPNASVAGVTNADANLSWSAVPSATVGYEYVLDNVATDPIGTGTATTALTFAAIGLTQSTTYYFHIRSVCSAGTYSTWSTVSFTTLATPPVNDNCSGASVLTIDDTFCNGTNNNGTNAGSTNSGVANPACFNYGLNDVWFSVSIPANVATINVSTDFTGGTLVDTEIELYSGVCGTLVQVACDQDSGTTILSNGSSYNSLITNAAVTGGQTYYVRVAGYTAAAVGTFCLKVATNTLGADSFNNKSFTVYPNPVKDVLNIEYTENISKIQVVNLLGQEVITKAVNATQNQIDMSGLAHGTYLVKVTSDDLVKTIKIIKE